MDYLSLQQTISIWLSSHPLILFFAIAWSLSWKGLALWKSARLNQKWWFIPLLLVNLFGLLEILFIFLIAPRIERKNKKEVEKSLS